jgi:hypothetical protein
MTIAAVPAVLTTRVSKPELRNFSKGGVPTETGRMQRTFSDAGFVEVVVTFPRIRPGAEANAYKAMVARLRSGEDILLDFCNPDRPPSADESTATAELTAAVDLRETTISITVDAIIIGEGNWFSIGDRAHMITRIVSAPEDPQGLGPLERDSPLNDPDPLLYSGATEGAYTVEVLPPMRDDYDASEPVKFDDLAIRVVMKDPREGDLDRDGRRGSAAITFIEHTA